MAGMSIVVLLTGGALLFAALIVLMIFPLPFSAKKWVIGLISKFTIGFYASMVLLAMMFVQEFTEQRKFDSRRRRAMNGEDGMNLHYFAFEYFKRQKQMYLIGIVLVMNAIAVILARYLKALIVQHEDLQAQKEAAARAAEQPARGNAQQAPAAE